MKLLSLLLVILLSGCAGNPVVTTVKVEVPVACIKAKPETPQYPLQNASPNEDIFSHTKKALAEIELRKAYEAKLEAVIQPCLKND